MDEVEINDLCVRTEVGISPHEQGKLQELYITICLRTSIKKAGETDHVEDTINYKTITNEVLFHVKNKKYNLIEAVATDVARICVVRHGVSSVKVIVSKPSALCLAKRSSVTIERCWGDFDWHEAHILIGSNKDPLHNLSQSISLLQRKVDITKMSKLFWTKPVMVGDGANDFINMAVFVKTKLDIVGLKCALLNIESQLGRVRTTDIPSSTIVIDLDLSFYGNDVAKYLLDCAPQGKRRFVPHPDTLKEPHVIIPLADLTPGFVHPQTEKSLEMMAKEISGQEDFTSFFPIVQKEDYLGIVIKARENVSKRKPSSLMQTNVNLLLKDGNANVSASLLHGSLLSTGISLGRNPSELNVSGQHGIHLLSGLTKPFSDVCQGNGLSASSDLFSDESHQLNGNTRLGKEPLSSERLPFRVSPVALVTGSAKRLGACIARKLHASGYRVVIHYNKSQAEATNLLRELNSIRGNSASMVQGNLTCDVSNTAQRIISETVRVWGRLDVLINNASQFYATPTGSVMEKEWDELVRANLTSPFFLSQAAFPFLKSSKGTIINLCDIHGVRPKVNYSVHSISKAGLHMCTFSLAKEFAPEVRVNGVAPGCILWPEDSWDGLLADEREQRMEETKKKQEESIGKVPFGRKGEPGNVADVVVFLSSSAEYVTGQIIAVDGGRILHQ